MLFQRISNILAQDLLRARARLLLLLLQLMRARGYSAPTVGSVVNWGQVHCMNVLLAVCMKAESAIIPSGPTIRPPRLLSLNHSKSLEFAHGLAYLSVSPSHQEYRHQCPRIESVLPGLQPLLGLAGHLRSARHRVFLKFERSRCTRCAQ